MKTSKPAPRKVTRAKAWAAVRKISAMLKKDRNAKIPAKLIEEANEVLVDFNLML